MLRKPRRARQVPTNGEVTLDRLHDDGRGRGGVAHHATVSPFDAAVAGFDIGIGQDDEAAGEAAAGRDLLQPRPRGLVKASLTRTTTCGAPTRCVKQSVASAAISANGSRRIRAGASLRAAATATSTASVSSRRSIASRPRAIVSIEAAARRQGGCQHALVIIGPGGKAVAVPARFRFGERAARSAGEGAWPRPKSVSKRNFAGAAIQ